MVTCKACNTTFPEGFTQEGVCKACRPVKAELTRQVYRPQRMTILKELQKHIREPDSAEREVEQISDREFSSPLAPLLRE